MILIIWLYLSWLMLLLGASIAIYHQYPEYLQLMGREPPLSGRLNQHLALLVAQAIVQSYRDGKPALDRQTLAEQLGLPAEPIAGVLGALEQPGILSQTRDEPPGYLPAKDPMIIALKDIVDGARKAGEDGYLNLTSLPSDPRIDALLRELEQATAAALGNRTLRDLA